MKRIIQPVIILLFFLSWNIAHAENCTIDIKKDVQSKNRIVFLAGGNAWSLFQTYLRELENRNIKFNVRQIKVNVVVNGNLQEFSQSWRDIITGQGPKERWEVRLKPLNADYDEKALNSAISQKWDIVCIPSTPAQTAKVEKKPEASDAKGEIPLEAKINLQQGLNYVKLKDYENAIKEFTLAIQKYPNYAVAYSGRAVAYMQQKKFNKAHEDLKKAVELAPNDPIIHYNLAALYSLTNKLDLALEALDRSLQLGFNDYESLRNDPDIKNLRKHPEFKRVLEKNKVFL